MDVCLPEEFLRLNTADDSREPASPVDWLGAEAWVTPRPPRAAAAVRTRQQDDPTWSVI